jgi:NAD-dependent DNA ligase
LLEAINDVANDLLDGVTIVLSGVMSLLAREKLEYWINAHGGKCTGSISGKTDILITGTKLEDGREVIMGGKYRKAMEKGTSIMSE